MKIQHLMPILALVLGGYASSVTALEPSAVLQQPKGQILVSQATAMAPAQHGMPLYAGNRVVVTADSKGMVVYADGCTISLPGNTLFTIGGPDQCKKGLAIPRTVAGFQSTRIGQTQMAKSAKNPVATIQQIKGSGRVNRAKAVRGMNLYNANRVTAGFNGRIIVKYSNGCETVLQSGQSLVIGDAPQCDRRDIRRPKTDDSNDSTSTTQNTQPTQSTTGATNAGSTAASSGIGMASWVAPVAVLGGFAGAMAISSNDDDASPE